jgi:amino acid adenylation domain-containing protein/non-ribosomal peptide synthase protein (TIGR01720 family)
MKELLEKIGKAGLLMNVVDGELKLFADGGQIDPEILNAIKAKKGEITAYLIQNEVGEISNTEYENIPLIPLAESYPISSAQRRLWLLSQFEGGSLAYNLPARVYLSDTCDIEKFKAAIDSTIERHEILRTVFKEDKNGEVRQWVLAKDYLGFKIDYKDFRKSKNKEKEIDEYVKDDANKPFDLEHGPLLRASLLQVTDEEYVFYYNMHHIISDGWSVEVLSKDILAYYESYKNNTEPNLKTLRIQYKDYSSWHLAQLEKESYKTHMEYWVNSLKGELPLLDLPSKKQRPKIKTYNGYTLRTYLDLETTTKLKKYSETNGGSLFMGLLAAWNVLMYRYTAQKEIIIGSPAAGRDHADLEDQIGFYVNTLALKNEIKPEENFNTFYKILKENAIKSYNHQMYPFDKLVEELDLQRNMSRSPVFDISITYHNTLGATEMQLFDEDSIQRITSFGFAKVKNDIEIHFKEIGNHLSFTLIYNDDVYESEMIEKLMMHYKLILNSLLTNPEKKLGEVEYLSEKEKNDLLFVFNDTEVAYQKDKTIIELFIQQVDKNPDNIAIVFEERKLTYKQLDKLSNQLADYLQKNYQINPENMVGVQLDRSELIVITILGIWKAGGVYIPIVPEYPSSRKEYIIKDTSLKLLITEVSFIHDMNYYEGNVFAIDVEFDSENYNSEKIFAPIKPSGLAYVIYTSGSTGEAKGVMIEHNGLINMAADHIQKLTLNASDKVLQFVSFSFDGSILDIFMTLLSGGTLIILGRQQIADHIKFIDYINEQCVTVMTLPPVYLRALNQAPFDSVRTIITAGEPANPKDAIYYAQNKNFYNAYGPTEATVNSTLYKVNPFINYASVPIGRVANNKQIYIVNESNQLQPLGVTGEICIGGAGLARGYLNQEELTKAKFISNPFKSGERLYKTGDLGRWLPEGIIEFAGRKDDQVKIRGYRIELGEIEHALQSYEAVDECVVMVKENENKEKELVAYITSKSEQNSNSLRLYLKDILPEYMLPAYYIQLASMPLTSNGKIDKRSLPDPQGLGVSSGVEYVEAVSEEEKILVEVWSDVLKREGIGIKDSFYNLGGDSIKSIQVVSRLKQKGYSLKVEHLLRTPVLEDLSLLMEKGSRFIDQSEVKGVVELTPVQKWFFETPTIKVHSHYNQSVLLKSKEELDKRLIEQSIIDLTVHHDVLRMVYKKNGSGYDQLNQGIAVKCYTINFYDLRESEDVFGAMSELGENLQSAINLAEGPLFKVVHFRLKDGDRIGLIIHHLVVDGVSWRILLEDFSQLYTGYKSGKKAVLPLKTDSFQRWALLQKDYAAGSKLQKERSYWKTICDQRIDGLPQDKEAATAECVLDSSVSLRLDKKTTELLQTRVHGVYKTEINDILLTGLGLALKEVFFSEKSVLKLEGHGREEIIDGVDISRTVGWFTTVYPFVLDVPKSQTITETLVGIKECLRRIPNKGIGYGILKYLSEEGLETTITPEIIFNYLGDFGSHVGRKKEESFFEYTPEYIGLGVAKENGNEGILEVLGMMVMGELNMSIRYSQERYNAVTLEKLIKSYEKNLRVLIEELSMCEGHYLTPSDLTFKGLSLEELAVINADGNVEDVYELSPLQEGMYYHWLSNQSSTVYFDQISYRIRAKELNFKNLKHAYDRLIKRYSILRTSFSNDYADRPLQIVRKEIASDFTHESINGKASNDTIQAYVGQVKQKDREKGFDLSSTSQMRLHIMELSDGTYEFIWSFHHILMDGWCLSILINDFNKFLSAEAEKQPLDLQPVMLYSTYINWLNKIDKESSLKYWKNYLVDYSQVAEVPFKIKTKESKYTESREHLLIDGEVFKKVDALCNQAGITHNTFIQGVWGYLLSCYNNTNDVVFGAVVSGRPAELRGVEEMVGLFINTIPVRVQYKSEQSPIQLLKDLQKSSIESLSHHYINLSDVQAQSELGMNLINHLLVFENYAVKEITAEGLLNNQQDEGVSIESMEAIEQTNYDFNIIVGPSPVSLNIGIAHNLYRYDKASIKRLAKHFDNLIKEFSEKWDQPLNKLNYLSEEERNELLVTLNDTAVSYPKNKTIVDLFEEQVIKTPDHIAVEFNEGRLSYLQLSESSNQLAHYLQNSYEIKPDDLIGIKLERSEWVIIAILAILKSGAAYVPIDPQYPLDRIDYIQKDSSCKVCIHEEELEKFKANQKNHSKDKVCSSTGPDHLAYVIYTSGSTGKPKGTLITHGAIVNTLLAQIDCFQIDSKNKGLQFASFSFDASVSETFIILLSGGCLSIINNADRNDPEQLTDFINNRNIDIATLPPTYLAKLDLSRLRGLKKLITAGEPAIYEKAMKQLEAGNYYNAYGPTEISICSTIYQLRKDHLIVDSVPIGKPINNTQIYLLNAEQQLVCKGVIGEIYIGGLGLAKGYLNQPELTKEKFVTNPFKSGERLYRTGDLGRWLPDGNMAFIGRMDDQVKIRGYRIELKEIEYALKSKNDLEDAVVVPTENENKEKELVAYITATTEQNTTDLRDYLKSILPGYMLPSYYVQLDTLPLTVNGKIDKRSLPNPHNSHLTGTAEYKAPRNETEEKLVKIWEEILKCKNIGVNSDFFELGGHSLKAMRLLTEYYKNFNVRLSLQDIFSKTRLFSHAELIDIQNWVMADSDQTLLQKENIETFNF